MDVDQCVEAYPSMAKKIFSSPRKQLRGWPKAKYDARHLENAIKDVVNARVGETTKEYVKAFESPDDLCKTLVTSFPI
jgi:hypothetical protein